MSPFNLLCVLNDHQWYGEASPLHDDGSFETWDACSRCGATLNRTRQTNRNMATATQVAPVAPRSVPPMTTSPSPASRLTSDSLGALRDALAGLDALLRERDDALALVAQLRTTAAQQASTDAARIKDLQRVLRELAETLAGAATGAAALSN